MSRAKVGPYSPQTKYFLVKLISIWQVICHSRVGGDPSLYEYYKIMDGFPPLAGMTIDGYEP